RRRAARLAALSQIPGGRAPARRAAAAPPGRPRSRCRRARGCFAACADRGGPAPDRANRLGSDVDRRLERTGCAYHEHAPSNGLSHCHALHHDVDLRIVRRCLTSSIPAGTPAPPPPAQRRPLTMKTPMSRFHIHDELTAPEGSVPVLRGALATGGQLPNFLGVLAGSPAAPRAYSRLDPQ